MNVPESFRPKKNSDGKLEQLLEGSTEKEVYFDYGKLYQRLFTHLDYYFKTKETRWNGIFYISDNFEENRYSFIRNVMEDIMTNMQIKYPYGEWILLDYYSDLEVTDLDDELYKAVLWKGDQYKVCMIYTSKNMTEKLTKDARKKAMLGHKAMVIGI